MKCDKHTMLLYAVTDRAWTGRETLRQQVEDALKGGVTCVQLREKELDEYERLLFGEDTAAPVEEEPAEAEDEAAEEAAPAEDTAE